MKKTFSFLIALVIVSLVACGVVIAISAADEYTGSIETAIAKLDSASKQTSLEKRYYQLYILVNYTETYPLNPKPADKPAQDAYEDFVEKFNDVNLDFVQADMAEIVNIEDAAQKQSRLQQLSDHLTHMKKAPYFDADSNAIKKIMTDVSSLSLDVAIGLLADLKPTSDALTTLDAFIDEPKSIGSGSIIEDSDATRKSSLALHNFIESCVDGTNLNPGYSAKYEQFLLDLSSYEVYEFKLLIASYYAYEYNDTSLKHARLNTISDRINACLVSKEHKNAPGYKETLELDPSYPVLSQKVAEINADIAKRTEDMKKTLQYSAPVEENFYKGAPYAELNYIFDSGTAFPHNMAWSHTHNANTVGNATYAEVVNEDGNKFLLMTLGKGTTELRDETGNSSAVGSVNGFFDMGRIGDTTNGLVFEFDIMTYSDTVKGFLISCSGMAKNNKSNVIDYFWFENGDIKYKPYHGYEGWVTAAQDVFTAGQWTHITLCYTTNDGTGAQAVTLYVDYEPIGVWANVSNRNGWLYDLTQFRLRPNSSHTTIALDNIQTYPGTTYRDRTNVIGNTNADKFKLYVDIVTDENYSELNRSYALNEIGKIYDAVKSDSSLASYVERYESLDQSDKDEISGAAREYVYNQLKYDVISRLDPFKRPDGSNGVTSENYESRRNASSAISKFITDNALNIVLTDPRIAEIQNQLVQLNMDIEHMENIVNLVYAMRRFDRASTYSAMQRRYAEIQELFELCAFYDVSNYQAVCDDPLIVEVEKLLKTDVLSYIESIPGVIDVRNRLERSKLLIECMEIIAAMEGYEATEEYWSDHYDEINVYVQVARDIVKSEVYNPDVEGFAEAKENFEAIDNYFYELLQLEHIEIIGDKLNDFKNVSSYIEKKGICTFVEKYVASNDLDMNNEEIVSLLELLEVYIRDVEIQFGTNEGVIRQNTIAFVNIVERMPTCTTYAELKALYEEAFNYSYAMDVTLEEVDVNAALDEFDSYNEILKETEAYSALLKGYVKQLKNAKNIKDMYPNLVKCSLVVDKISTDIEGVDDAFNTYNEYLANYNKGIEDVNSAIDETTNIVCSVRTVSIHESILEFFKKIFNN